MDRPAVALVRPTGIVDGVDWARFEARRLPRLDVEYLARLRAAATYSSVVAEVREPTGVGMPVVEMPARDPRRWRMFVGCARTRRRMTTWRLRWRSLAGGRGLGRWGLLGRDG